MLVINFTKEKRKPLPVPDWLKNPVTGEEALKRAEQYDERMQRLIQGQDSSERR